MYRTSSLLKTIRIMMSKQQNEHGIFVLLLLFFLLCVSAFEGHGRNRQTAELGRLLIWWPHIGFGFAGKRKLLFRCAKWCDNFHSQVGRATLLQQGRRTRARARTHRINSSIRFCGFCASPHLMADDYSLLYAIGPEPDWSCWNNLFPLFGSGRSSFFP